jgi:glycosyltransferase involved in cell wall biosynthesis
MHIIVTSQALTPWYGGSAISEASLCSHLGKNCKVTVLCREGAVDYAFVQSFGLKEVREYQPREVVDAWRKPGHWLRQLIDSADVFHLNGHWKWENYFFARLCVGRGVPYVLHPRGMLLVGHRRVLLKRIFNLMIGNWIVRNASAVIALSQFERTQFLPYRTREDRVVVIPNGISTPGPSRVNNSVASVNGQGSFFLYLGRLEARKNLVFLVRVFDRYVKQGGKSNLLLVGPVERGYDRVVAGEIEALGLGERVHMHAPIYEPERSQYLRKAQAVIYPTNDEPFGRVPFETIAAGGVPVVPDESGSAEYLKPFLPDCIYRHQDQESLLLTMKQIEARNSGLDDRLETARHWVAERLDWTGITDTVMELYQKLSLKSARDGAKIRA